MPKFVIERDIPEAGKMSPQQLRAISQKSCGVLREIGPQIQWVQSYVTDDKIYCVYVAPDETLYAARPARWFPSKSDLANSNAMIDPTYS